VILTNAGVSGEADKAICAAFEAVGVKHCQVFGGSWIEQQLDESVRLRMLVPRIYARGGRVAEEAAGQAASSINHRQYGPDSINPSGRHNDRQYP